MATGSATQEAQPSGGGPEQGERRDAPGHCLDPENEEPRTRVDPPSGLLRRCLPGEPPPEPRSDWVPPPPPPPRDPRSRPLGPPQRLRLRNTLTGQEHVITVLGSQEGGPLQQALPWNAHAGGYAWRCGGDPLDPETPLDPENPLDPDPDDSPPPVLLYFADDFVEI